MREAAASRSKRLGAPAWFWATRAGRRGRSGFSGPAGPSPTRRTANTGSGLAQGQGRPGRGGLRDLPPGVDAQRPPRVTAATASGPRSTTRRASPATTRAAAEAPGRSSKNIDILSASRNPGFMAAPNPPPADPAAGVAQLASAAQPGAACPPPGPVGSSSRCSPSTPGSGPASKTVVLHKFGTDPGYDAFRARSCSAATPARPRVPGSSMNWQPGARRGRLLEHLPGGPVLQRGHAGGDLRYSPCDQLQ